jgi:transcriptional regulator with XRE-family HTH domain
VPYDSRMKANQLEMIMTKRKNLGERINSRRKAAGMTVEDFAARSGVSAQTVRRYEKGKVLFVNPLTLRMMAEALGCGVL